MEGGASEHRHRHLVCLRNRTSCIHFTRALLQMCLHVASTPSYIISYLSDWAYCTEERPSTPKPWKHAKTQIYTSSFPPFSSLRLSLSLSLLRWSVCHAPRPLHALPTQRHDTCAVPQLADCRGAAVASAAFFPRHASLPCSGRRRKRNDCTPAGWLGQLLRRRRRWLTQRTVRLNYFSAGLRSRRWGGGALTVAHGGSGREHAGRGRP